MSIAPLLDIIHAGRQDSWAERNKAAFDALFGGPDGRYPKSAAKVLTIRAPEMSADSGVPFAAYIHPSNPATAVERIAIPLADELRKTPEFIGVG